MKRLPCSTVLTRCGHCCGFVVWLLVLLATAGCGSAAPPAQDDLGIPVVRLISPRKRTITRTVEQPSFVESYERSSVFPKMTAYIAKWNVDIGDKVKKGDVLAKLFVPELVEQFGTKKATVTLDEKRIKLANEALRVAQANVKAASARLAEARALLLQYQAEVNRWAVQVKRLKRETDRGILAPQILLETENQWKSSIAAQNAAEATIKKAEAELLSREAAQSEAEVAIEVATANLAVAQSEARRLEALVGYLVLPAPFDGVITVRNANTYDFVLPMTGEPSAMARSPQLSPGKEAAPIYVVDRTDIVRVFVDIPEYAANYVHVGTKASVLIRAFRDQPIDAAITRTSWALNVRSRTLRAEIDLPNTDSKILPGMYAYGNVLIECPGVWALPLTALDYSGDKTYYWSCVDGKAMRTEIRTGVSDDEWIEVANRQLLDSEGTNRWAPITGSEQVILGDLSILADGEPVQTTSAIAESAPSP